MGEDEQKHELKGLEGQVCNRGHWRGKCLL